VSAGASWAGAAEHIVSSSRPPGASLDELATFVPDEMLDDLTLTGTPAQVRGRLPTVEQALAARGVDEVVYQVGTRGATAEAAAAGATALIDCCAPVGAP
jgi:hypothetical protein